MFNFLILISKIFTGNEPQVKVTSLLQVPSKHPSHRYSDFILDFNSIITAPVPLPKPPLLRHNDLRHRLDPHRLTATSALPRSTMLPPTEQPTHPAPPPARLKPAIFPSDLGRVTRLHRLSRGAVVKNEKK